MKRITSIILVTLFVVSLFAFVGCSNTDEMQQKIEELQATINQLSTIVTKLNAQQLTATINELSAKIEEIKAIGEQQAEQIANLQDELNYKFCGEFYTLTEAYKLGFLNDTDIKDIAYYYSDVVVDGGLNQEEDKDYTPTQKNPTELDEETKTKITKCYLYNKVENSNAIETLEIRYYYGTYNQCVVVFIYEKLQNHYIDLVFEDIKIGEQEFLRYNINSIIVWKEV